MSTSSTPTRAARHQLWLGLALVLAGAAFLLDNLHFLELRRILPFWPVVMVALGAARLLTATPGDRGEQFLGCLLLGLGSLLLLRRLGWLHLEWRDLWPLALIGLGVLVMTRQPGQSGALGQAFGSVHRDSHERQLNVKALLSGQQIRVQSQDFAGGQLHALMAGVELDLSQAGFQHAVLDVSVVMAGLELRLPPDCRLRVTASSVLGQVEDKTLPLAQASRELELRGALVLGGITVRH